MITIIDILYTVGLTFGVGASTFALTFYIQALGDDVIDASEKRFMHTVYVVLRIGMILLFLGLLGNELFGTDILTSPQAAWILLFVITLNAILMSHHMMPMRFGPILAGGSWYSLFLVSKTPVADLTYTYMTIAYILFLALFYFVFHFLKNKFVK